MTLKKKLLFIPALAFISLIFLSAVYAGNNETIIVGANIIGDLAANAEINIEIAPNSVNFGDVEIGQESDTIRVNVTNKGNIDVNVFPQLGDSSDKAFENIYFQKRKTGNSSGLYKIGEYSLNIAQPTTDSGRADYCYMKLDLTNVNSGDVDEDFIGSRDAEIIFVALAA